ncbi:MAG: LacI family transcriptional regulator [Lachnospiraceae bacterium]|nr:LacI family transcriptional regulator [Lachnospiraceae bacterium]
MAVTAKELAQMCGVSRMTVHRALTDTGRINQQTKELILKKAKECGYRPDLLARGLVKGQTFYIGVVVLDVNNRYFSQLLSAIGMEARRRGYFVNITLHEENKEMEKEQLERLVDYHVDGVILSSVNQGEEYREFLQSLDTPIVTIGNKIADGIPFVSIQEKKAAREATEVILQKGYEKIVFVCPPLEQTETNTYVHQQRLEGFQEAVAEWNRKLDQEQSEVDTVIIDRNEGFVESTCEELYQTEKRTACFCTGDMFALDIMKYMEGQGRIAGRDYGIIGFDGIDMLNYVAPRLYTIYNPVEEVAKEAVKLLFRLMNGEAEGDNTVILNCQIQEGETL